MKKIVFLFSVMLALPLTAQVPDHTIWNTFLKKYVDNNGHVNYKAIAVNKAELNGYLSELVKNQPQNSWGHEEKMAYYINAYNAYTIKLIVDNYPLKSIKDIASPWDKKFIPLNGKLESLNHIEHEILRKMGDARIHFAINCASISCPKLLNEAFTAQKLNKQLDAVAIDFINNPQKNKLEENTIGISKIFDWFKKDFEQNGSLIDFLNRYSKTVINPKAKIGYLEYNWNLNGK